MKAVAPIATCAVAASAVAKWMLREHDRTTTVILITASRDEATHADARRFNAMVVLDKLFELEVFRRVVQELIPAGSVSQNRLWHRFSSGATQVESLCHKVLKRGPSCGRIPRAKCSPHAELAA